MKLNALLITSGLLVAITGAATADDHLFNAGVANDDEPTNSAPHPTGLFGGSTASTHSQATTENPAGHSGDLAPGQGSPFTGEETKTPATDTDAANDHANAGPNGRASSAPGHNKQ